jgi:hypothetical protein
MLMNRCSYLLSLFTCFGAITQPYNPNIVFIIATVVLTHYWWCVFHYCGRVARRFYLP